MNRKFFNTIIWIFVFLLLIVSLVKLVRNPFTLGLIVLAFASLIFAQLISPSKANFFIAFGLVVISLVFLSTITTWLAIALLLVLFISDNQGVFELVREALFSKGNDLTANEFVTINLEEERTFNLSRKKNEWFKPEKDDDEIYEWQDINYSKFLGNSVVDLANTIVPKGANVILIRKGIGKVKLLVPQEVAVSLSLNILAGKIVIDERSLNLVNETYHFRSSDYESSSRKLKVAVSLLFGEIEVVFL